MDSELDDDQTHENQKQKLKHLINRIRKMKVNALATDDDQSSVVSQQQEQRVEILKNNFFGIFSYFIFQRFS